MCLFCLEASPSYNRSLVCQAALNKNPNNQQLPRFTKFKFSEGDPDRFGCTMTEDLGKYDSETMDPLEMVDQSQPVNPRMHYVVLKMTSSGRHLKWYLNLCELQIYIWFMVSGGGRCMGAASWPALLPEAHLFPNIQSPQHSPPGRDWYKTVLWTIIHAFTSNFLEI